MDLFEGSLLKLERATEHLDRLTDQIEKHNFGVFEFRVDQSHESAYHVFRERNPVDPRWALGVGDVVHNLRTALDYAVGDAVGAAGRKATRHHWFPIAVTEAAWLAIHESIGKFRDWHPPLQGVTAAVNDFIASAQPYVGRKPSNAEQMPLAIVQRMDNTDKHRALHVGILHVADETPNLRIDPGGSSFLQVNILAQAVSGTSLVDGTEVFRYQILRPVGDSDPKVHMKHTLPITVAFEGAANLSIPLKRLREFITEFATIISGINERAVSRLL